MCPGFRAQKTIHKQEPVSELLHAVSDMFRNYCVQFQRCIRQFRNYCVQLHICFRQFQNYFVQFQRCFRQFRNYCAQCQIRFGIIACSFRFVSDSFRIISHSFRDVSDSFGIIVCHARSLQRLEIISSDQWCRNYRNACIWSTAAIISNLGSWRDFADIVIKNDHMLRSACLHQQLSPI